MTGAPNCRNSASTVRVDAYTLAKDISGIGFKTADQITEKVGIPTWESIIRACAGISHCLLEATNSGHCALPREMLADQAKALLAIDEPLIREALERLLVNREVLEEQIGEHPLIFLPALRATEAGIAAKIALPVPESQTAIAPRGGAEHPVRRMLAEDKLESYKTVIEPEEVQANPVCWKGSRKSSNVF